MGWNNTVLSFPPFLLIDDDYYDFPTMDDSPQPKTPTRNLMEAFNREYRYDGNGQEQDDNQPLIILTSTVPPKKWVRTDALGSEKAAPQLMDLAHMKGNACTDRKF